MASGMRPAASRPVASRSVAAGAARRRTAGSTVGRVRGSTLGPTPASMTERKRIPALAPGVDRVDRSLLAAGASECGNPLARTAPTKLTVPPSTDIGIGIATLRHWGLEPDPTKERFAVLPPGSEWPERLRTPETGKRRTVANVATRLGVVEVASAHRCVGLVNRPADRRAEASA